MLLVLLASSYSAPGRKISRELKLRHPGNLAIPTGLGIISPEGDLGLSRSYLLIPYSVKAASVIRGHLTPAGAVELEESRFHFVVFSFIVLLAVCGLIFGGIKSRSRGKGA